MYSVVAFYKFATIRQGALADLRGYLHKLGKSLELCGLIILAPEGINGTIAGNREHIVLFKKDLTDHFGTILFKDSAATAKPYKRFKVKVREEIVTIGNPALKPAGNDNTHISPAEWNRVLAQEDVIVIDTRNEYETELGMFEHAIDPKLKEFSEFPEFVEQAALPKDKKVLMYCTGGIRCEKAALEMKRQGYEQVYQLEGGILNYLQQFPDGYFKGECFVFDHRVAVDEHLSPSETYRLCPHCGNPGDQEITCARCEKQAAVICIRCKQIPARNTCSKDCANHFKKRGLAVNV